MGEVNEGHLRMMNTDMTGMKEAFGDELARGNPSTNSYLKARYVATKHVLRRRRRQDPIDRTIQVVAIATSRDRTLQSGKLFLIDLNGSETNSDLAGPDAARPGRPLAELAGDRPLLRRRAGGRRGAGPVPDLLVGRPGPVGGARPRDEHRAVRHLRARHGERQRQQRRPLADLRRSRTTGTSCRAR